MAGSKKTGARRWPTPVAVLGGVLLVLGIFGTIAWALTAAVASDYGATAEGTLAYEIDMVGPIDAEKDATYLGGWDEAGELVWEGSQEELDAIKAEGREALQQEYRQWRLYPSLFLILVGAITLTMGIVGWRMNKQGTYWRGL